MTALLARGASARLMQTVGRYTAPTAPTDESTPVAPGGPAASTRHGGWRGALLRALAWSTLAKFVALLLLWWLFFASYAPPTPASVSRHLDLAAPAPVAVPTKGN